MPVLDEEKWGQYTKYNLISNYGYNLMSIVPDHGGLITHLSFLVKGQIIPILSPVKDEHELEHNRFFKQCWLFPFPNRVADGKFTFKGQNYQLPVNEESLGNALHGFLFDKPWRFREHNIDTDDANFTLFNKYDGNYPGFPFPFEVMIELDYNTSGYINFSVQCTNKGEHPMPFGCGWHPFFNFGGLNADEINFETPTLEKFELNNKNIPTGQIIDTEKFENGALSGHQLDDCYRINTDNHFASFFIEKQGPSEHIKMEFWQESKPGKFGYVQLFTPPDRSALAIEPMTCAIDAFNSGEGLIELKPGKQFYASFGIKLHT